MQRHRRAGARRVSGLLKHALCIAAALTVVCIAHDARSQGVTAQPAPAASSSNPFSGWFGRSETAAPAAAAPAAQQPTQRARKRISKSKKQTPPVVAEPAPADDQATELQQQAAEPDWPNAAANVGGPLIVPLTVKTVREMIEPEPPVVSENELSDIDRASQPEIAATSAPAPVTPPTTDGNGSIDIGEAEQTRVFAMGDTVKAMIQSAWFEPLLLMIAGAFAALTAVRVFA